MMLANLFRFDENDNIFEVLLCRLVNKQIYDNKKHRKNMGIHLLYTFSRQNVAIFIIE